MAGGNAEEQHPRMADAAALVYKTINSDQSSESLKFDNGDSQGSECGPS